MGRLRRGGGSVGAAVLLALSSYFALAVVGTTPALAKCQPNRTNNGQTYWDGWLRGAGTVGGIYSSILNYSPWVQPGSQVTAWTMLNNGGSWWAQVGWWESPYGVRYTFVQWTPSAGQFQTHFWTPAQPVGQSTYYTTLWNYTPGKFTFQVASSTIDTETAAFTPNDGQAFGEINTLASQMPGALYAPEDFSNTNWWVSGWSAFNGSPYDSSTTYFNIAKYSSTHLQIGDKACQY